jgi:hypothetical protein
MLSDRIHHKRVAVVGCSSEITGSQLGSHIEGHDFVVRCDSVWPRSNPEDVGDRTDILFHKTQVDKEFYFFPYVPLVIWIGPEDNETYRANRYLGVMDSEYIYEPRLHNLTCTNALNLILDCDPAKIYMVGCDFNSSVNPDQEWVCAHLLHNPKVTMADHVKRALIPTGIKV